MDKHALRKIPRPEPLPSDGASYQSWYRFITTDWQDDMLIVNFFGQDSEKGDLLPKYRFFLKQDDYITQDLRTEKTRWLNGAFHTSGYDIASSWNLHKEFRTPDDYKRLCDFLKDYEPLPILPIVAFSGKADIKVKVEEACVVYWSQIRKVINQFEEKRLTWAQVNEICDAVQAAQLDPGKEADKQHLKDIRSAKEQKYDAIASGRCPRCSGTLVLRSGKYGQFYGCSNYPNCKYTHPA